MSMHYQPNHTQSNANRLDRLRTLAEASRKRLGPRLSRLSLPGRLMVDIDPLTIGLTVTIEDISTGSVTATIDLSEYPTDVETILAIGDLYRLQIDCEAIGNQRDGILPLLPARLETKQVAPSSHGNLEQQKVQLRFKWLLGGVTERALVDFLSALQNSLIRDSK